MNDEQPPKREKEPNDSLRAVAPGLARIAFDAWRRTTEWSVKASVSTSSRLARAAVSGESPAQLGSDLRQYVRNVLGLEGAPDGPPPPDPEAPSTLRKQGDELMRRSADVDYQEDAHPAYERILSELAPDEGRILRLLALEGPQASVNVRGGIIPLESTSQLVALGLTMIGAEAGCRHADRVHAYLNNIHRLGLASFSREPLEDPLKYQVLEAQPEVIAALQKAGRGARTVRRSILLTPFGEDFCETCLPLHTVEIDELPVDPGPAPMATPPEPRPAPER